MSKKECNIQGLDLILEDIKKIKFHKLTYTIFNVSQVDPVGFQIVHSEGHTNLIDHRAVKSKEDLMLMFENCKAKMDLKSSAFIVYDFGYYNDLSNYREMVVFIHYISDLTGIKKNIIMASNVQQILTYLDVQNLIRIQDPEDFVFEKIRAECAAIQRK